MQASRSLSILERLRKGIAARFTRSGSAASASIGAGANFKIVKEVLLVDIDAHARCSSLDDLYQKWALCWLTDALLDAWGQASEKEICDFVTEASRHYVTQIQTFLVPGSPDKKILLPNGASLTFTQLCDTVAKIMRLWFAAIPELYAILHASLMPQLMHLSCSLVVADLWLSDATDDIGATMKKLSRCSDTLCGKTDDLLNLGRISGYDKCLTLQQIRLVMAYRQMMGADAMQVPQRINVLLGWLPVLCGLEGLWARITKGKSIAEGLPLQLANGQLLQQIDVAEAEQNKRIITNYRGVLKKLQALITIFLSPTKVSFDPDAVENDISLLQCMGQYLLHHNTQAIEATADRLVICAKALHATGLETLGAGTIDHLEAVADSVESTSVMPLRSVAQVTPTTVVEIIDIIPWSVTPLLLVKGAPSQTLKLLLQSRFAAGEYLAKFKETLPKELIASLKDTPTLLNLNLKTLTQRITQFWSKTLASPDKMILKKLYEPLCSDFAGEGAGICAADRLLRTMAEVLLEPLAMHESNRWLLLSLLALQPDEDSGHFNDAMTRFFCNDGVFAALWQRQVSVIFGTVAVVPGLKTVQKHIATNKAWYSWTAPPYSRHMQRLRIINRATARQALQTHRLYVGISDRRVIVPDREAVDALLQPVCSAQNYQQVREHINAWVACIVSRCGDYP